MEAVPECTQCLNSDLQCLVRVLNFAVVDGHLEHNPLAGTKKLREPRRPRRYLTKSEIALLIENAEPRFKPLLLAMVYTGARKGELTALRWRDIDFERGKIALVRPKVGNCDYIDLHPALATELTRVRESRKGDDGKGPAAEDHVFLSWHGTPYRDIRKVWNLALKAAGLAGRPGLTPHSVRHSFATHFLEGGGSVTDLMTQLGHSKLETTQIYAAAVSERRRATVLAMEFGGQAAQVVNVSAPAASVSSGLGDGVASPDCTGSRSMLHQRVAPRLASSVDTPQNEHRGARGDTVEQRALAGGCHGRHRDHDSGSG